MKDNSLLLSRAKNAVISHDWALAARLYRQLLRDSPQDISLLNQLGELYMKSGKDEQALSVYKKIVEISPRDSQPYITMGGIYRRLGDYESAIAVLERALVEDGTNPQISYNLGFTYKLMNQLDDALSCFEEVIELNPDDVLAYNHLGTIYSMQGDEESALQSYLRGLSIDPHHPVLLFNVAKTYEALGENEKAANSYEGVLKSKPLWEEALENYTHLLIKLCRRKTARSIAKRAVQIAPNNERLVKILKDVEDAEGENGFSFGEDDEAEEKNDVVETAADSAEANDSPEADFSTEDFSDGVFESEEDKSAAEEIPKADENSVAEESTVSAEEGGEDENQMSDDALLFDDEEIDVFGDESVSFDDEENSLENEIVEDAGEEVDGIFDSAEDADEVDGNFNTDEETAETDESGWETLHPEKVIIIADGEKPSARTDEDDDFDSPDEMELLSPEELEEIESQGENPAETPAEREVFGAEELELFKTLRGLLDYLPEEKRDEFLSSRTRILLDFVISKLSGGKGLLGTVNSMIESGEIVQPSDGQNSAENGFSDADGEKTIADGIRVLENLISELDDEKLKAAMKDELKRVAL